MDEFIIKKYKKLYLKAGKAYLFDVPALKQWRKENRYPQHQYPKH